MMTIKEVLDMDKDKLINKMNSDLIEVSLYASKLSRHASHLVKKYNGTNNCLRFRYIFDEEEEVYSLIDERGEFGPWFSFSEHDIDELTKFLNYLHSLYEDVCAELDHKEEEIRILTESPAACCMDNSVFEIISEINRIFTLILLKGQISENVELEKDHLKIILNALQIIAREQGLMED